mmetsp:Transcript_40506/g.97765  ORF Transcript_40506/g.97765 Transcript_40506/m.97765 type:complete len:206 (-) Transcript_40506:119-736(-)
MDRSLDSCVDLCKLVFTISAAVAKSHPPTGQLLHLLPDQHHTQPADQHHSLHDTQPPDQPVGQQDALRPGQHHVQHDALPPGQRQDQPLAQHDAQPLDQLEILPLAQPHGQLPGQHGIQHLRRLLAPLRNPQDNRRLSLLDGMRERAPKSLISLIFDCHEDQHLTGSDEDSAKNKLMRIQNWWRTRRLAWGAKEYQGRTCVTFQR